jgi:hypothetical protein
LVREGSGIKIKIKIRITTKTKTTIGSLCAQRDRLFGFEAPSFVAFVRFVVPSAQTWATGAESIGKGFAPPHRRWQK